MIFEDSSNIFIFHYLSRDFLFCVTCQARFSVLSSFMANYCNIVVLVANRTVVPWLVISVEPIVNFADCFLEIKSGKFLNISTSLELSASILQSVYIGQDKATANSIIEKTVNVVSVCSIFGWHVKFIVSVPEEGESSSQHVFKNAFSIMMESQRRICAQTLPQPIPERNKTDKLFNDLLQLANQRGLKLPHSDIESAKKYSVFYDYNFNFMVYRWSSCDTY